MADRVLDGVERASKSRLGFSVREDSLLSLELPYNGVCFPKREIGIEYPWHSAFDEKIKFIRSALGYIALDILDFCFVARMQNEIIIIIIKRIREYRCK